MPTTISIWRLDFQGSSNHTNPTR